MLEQPLSFCDRINDMRRALQCMRRWGAPCRDLELFANVCYEPEADDALDDLIAKFSRTVRWLDEGFVVPETEELRALTAKGAEFLSASGCRPDVADMLRPISAYVVGATDAMAS